jgi:hypothetical protein
MISKNGFLPDYTPYINLTGVLTLPAPIVLFTPEQATGWGPPSQGFIVAKIMNETYSGTLNEAVMTATGANGTTSYPVIYFDGVSNWRDTRTYPNGLAFVKNVPDGETVTLQITSHESTYAQVLPIHANAEGGALLSGKLFPQGSGSISISPPSGDFGNVPVGGSSAPQPGALINNGPGNLTVLSAYWIGDTTQWSPSPGTCPAIATWPFTLTPGQSCDLASAFTPKSVGAKRLTVVVNSSANNTPVLNFPMSGAGVTPYKLTINISGGGTVNNYNNLVTPPLDPTSAATHTYLYGDGSEFNLGGDPAESFTGWVGAGSAVTCSGVGYCHFILNSDTTVTAPFNPRVKIHGNNAPYQWLKDAYGVSNNYAQIDVRNMTFNENLNLDGGINVILKGGLEADFATVNGYSYLQGTLTVVSGSLTVANLTVK